MTERPIDQQADGRTDSKGSSITMKLKKNKNKYFSFEMNEMGKGGRICAGGNNMGFASGTLHVCNYSFTSFYEQCKMKLEEILIQNYHDRLFCCVNVCRSVPISRF